MNVHVKRVFSIQEERQAQFHALRKVQSQYASGECSADFYSQSMARVTSTFQALSQEIITLATTFRDAKLEEAVQILEDLQSKEKEKLDLTVKWQVMLQKEGVEERSNGDERGATGTGFSASDQEKSRLKRKLAAVEGEIADLLRDFRYECEPFLTSQ